MARTERIYIRLSEAEKALARAIAQQRHWSMAAVARQAYLLGLKLLNPTRKETRHG